MNKVIVIAGPTAVGKTSLSIKLAKELGGEIVSADSMQVYKTLDIGTAKPSQSEMEGITHHMLDVCEPDIRYSVADYVQAASQAVNSIFDKGKLPIIVGGTGLYIDHLLFETDFNEGDSNPELRKKLQEKAEQLGGAELRKELYSVDPESAERLHDNDVRRIIRALEFYYVTGKTITDHNKNNTLNSPRFQFDYFVLQCSDRSVLYNRINTRVDVMMNNGLLEEAERVCNAEWFTNSTASQAIGYKEFLNYFNGTSSLNECVELLKQHSRNYAKRQLTWFRAKEYADFLNVDVEESPFDTVISKIQKGLKC